MSTKLIFCISLALVIAHVGHAGEVARWDFDETTGTIATDKSGLYIATLTGGDTLDVGGKFGSGIDFAGDGGAAVDAASSEAFRFTGDFSIALWVNSDVDYGDHTRFVDLSAVDGGLQDSYRLFTHSGGNSDNFKFMSRQNGSNTQNIHTRDMPAETWMLLVVRHDLDGDVTMNVLQDGDVVDAAFVAANSESWPTAGPIVYADSELKFGRLIGTGRKFDGKMDGVAFYDELLTDAEVATIFNAAPSPKTIAAGPKPDDATVDVPSDAVLSWVPGQFANTHTVYLRTAYEDVNNAGPADPSGVLLSSEQDVNSFDVGVLDFGKTYYWRVDEVNGTPDKTVFEGDVWSFEVEPYAIAIPGSTIAVTASSSANEFSMPQKAVDGSGLDPNTGTHAIDPETMWFTAAVDLDPWIQFEFDDVKKLDVITVWNSNGSAESAIGWGVKDVEIQYSVDGENWESLADTHQFSRAPGLPTYNQPDQISFNGAAAQCVRLNIQSNWGDVLMSYSLSEVQFSMIPVRARTPEPASGSGDILPNSSLTWRAGREAVQSTVYVSIDPNEVAEGAAPSETLNGNSLDLGPLDLQMGRAYYWRVDEINEAEAVSVWAGPVWSLSTVASLVVDDFERYNNISPNRPFQTWLDGFGYSADEFFPAGYGGNGTGAGIGHDIWSLSSPHYDGDIMEGTNTIAGSGRSMPFYYTNTGGVASQTERTFAVAQDWTVGGAQTLSIAFSGLAGNTGTLYAKINGTKITYEGDPANIALPVWQAWNIDLSSMNVQGVTTLQIGADGSGASGMVLIDDIKLYAEPGEVITPVDPGTANLVGAWSFDEGSGTTVADSSGNGYTGTIVGATWDTGVQGSALYFSETAYVETAYAGITGTASRTCCAWIKTAEADRGFVSWGLNTVGNKWRMRLDATGGLRIEVNGGNHFGQAFLADDEWHHTAVVMEDDGTPDCSETLLYVDGLSETTRAITDEPIDTDPTGEFRIGKSTYDTFGFIGVIDDVRVYDRALSEAEILSLTGRTMPVDKPF